MSLDFTIPNAFEILKIIKTKKKVVMAQQFYKKEEI